MLTISEFSEMCHLSPQTLRFYHSEGLLLPSGVDEQTGYRSYRFEQVEQAMLITVLRRTGMSVKTVRRALDEPDERRALLEQHDREVQRARREQDEALGDARRFFDSWPQPRLRRAEAVTVVSKPVPLPATGPNDWDADVAAVAATVAEVVGAVESCGAAVSGPPWRAFANETPEQRRRTLTAEGSAWLVKVPVTADRRAVAALREEVEVQEVEVQDFAARDELSIFIPGRDTMDKYSTSIARLTGHRLDSAYIDLGRMRFVLHGDGVEATAAVRPLDGAGDAGSRPGAG